MDNYIWEDLPYSNLFLKSLFEMQQLNYMCDITLIVGNEQIRAHKLVLSTASFYFKTMASAGLQECETNEMIFPHIKIEVLRSIIYFIYTGKIELNEQNIYDIMTAAHLFQLSILKLVIGHYLITHINEQNSLDILINSKLYGYEELFSKVLKYILKKKCAIINQEKFIQCPIDCIKLILCQSNLNANELCKVTHFIRKHFNIEYKNMIEYTFEDFFNYYIRNNESNQIFCSILEILKNIAIKNYSTQYISNVLNKQFVKNEVILSIGGKSEKSTWPTVECYSNNVGWSLWLPCLMSSSEYPDKRCIVSNMNMERQGCAVARLEDNNTVFVVGGRKNGPDTSFLSTCEQYNVTENIWRSVARLPRAIFMSAAAAVENVVYCTGGLFDNEEPCNEVWEYLEKKNRWRSLPPLLEARYAHGACSVYGTLYILGGHGKNRKSIFNKLNIKLVNLVPAKPNTFISSVERYNTDLQKWSRVCQMLEPKYSFGCVAYNEFIYVIGGISANNDTGKLTSSVHRYNVLTDTWKQCADMLIAKRGFGCTVKDGKIYCVGGNNTSGSLVTVEVLNPETNRWHYLHERLQTPRENNVAVTLSVDIEKTSVAI